MSRATGRARGSLILAGGGLRIATGASGTPVDVTVSGNSAVPTGSGGGVDNSGTAALTNVTVTRNTVSNQGGGIVTSGP